MKKDSQMNLIVNELELDNFIDEYDKAQDRQLA